MQRLKKSKPLFSKVIIEQTDSWQDRKKKIAKLQIQDAVHNLGVGLKEAKYHIDTIKEYNKFVNRLRKHFKYL